MTEEEEDIISERRKRKEAKEGKFFKLYVNAKIENYFLKIRKFSPLLTDISSKVAHLMK